MNITDKQIEQLKEALGAKKLEEIIPELKPAFDPKKIYIYNSSSMYKLQRLNINDEYAFISLDDSECFAYGTGSAQQQIEYANHKLHVFDNYRDFIKWAYSNLK